MGQTKKIIKFQILKGKGHCSRGEDCKFAHSPEELRHNDATSSAGPQMGCAGIKRPHDFADQQMVNTVDIRNRKVWISDKTGLVRLPNRSDFQQRNRLAFGRWVYRPWNSSYQTKINRMLV